MLMKLFLDSLVREIANLHENRVRVRFIGDRGCPRERARAQHGGRGIAHRGQSRARALGRGRLRRPLGYRTRLPLARGRRRRGHARAGGHHGDAAGRAARARRPAGSRPSDPHRRGAAGEQLPACGISPTPSSTSRTCCGRNSPPRTSRRRSSSSRSASAGSAKPRRKSPRKPMLRLRIFTAIILGGVLLLGLFALEPRWTVPAFGAVFTIGAWEWAAFGGLRTLPARLCYAGAIALLLLLSWRWTGDPGRLETLLGAGVRVVVDRFRLAAARARAASAAAHAGLRRAGARARVPGARAPGWRASRAGERPDDRAVARVPGHRGGHRRVLRRAGLGQAQARSAGEPGQDLGGRARGAGGGRARGVGRRRPFRPAGAARGGLRMRRRRLFSGGRFDREHVQAHGGAQGLAAGCCRDTAACWIASTA